ncbi:dirigent protein 2-like [Coffea eugenioides]|uniref:dirigent protein 2-like n=1 Tax=Coffea eugenioides TaxID=49369 RepID=UPI000F60B4C1|nr:dirigent protein 2-like [Coffea eugenioides]
MAKGSALASIQISLVLLLAIFVCSEADLLDPYYCCRGKETKITVYLQLFTGGPKTTSVAVAGAPGRPRTLSEFGTIFVNDANMTEGISYRSPTIGRAQGLYIVSARNGNSSQGIFSFIFSNSQYNGSTLEFQGPGFNLQTGGPTSEIPVIGGTKKFRLARGYGLFKIVRQNLSLNNTVIMGNITVVSNNKFE